jgi:pimeloyl-ACP methyl ester carboxylesterase
MSGLHSASARISTNVRFFMWRLAFRILGRLEPALAAAAAERLFFAPGRPRRSRGQMLLEQGQRLQVPFGSRRLAAWRWGRGPVVVLLHGWSGRAAQLTSFVAPLVGRGFSVVALDAPGHGRSGRGLSSAPEFARALRAVVDAVGGAAGVVAHSLGAAAAVLAASDGLAVGRLVLLAPPANPPAWVGRFVTRLGIPPDVVDRMRRRSERRIGLRWDQLDITALAASGTAPLLVVHDREDAEVPLRDGVAIAGAWKGSRLIQTAGLGHNRILRDPNVVARAVAFLAEGGAVRRCPTCAAPLADAAVSACEQCLLDRELFDRELRWTAPAPA